jgi:hypothetical protein
MAYNGLFSVVSDPPDLTHFQEKLLTELKMLEYLILLVD